MVHHANTVGRTDHGIEVAAGRRHKRTRTPGRCDLERVRPAVRRQLLRAPAVATTSSSPIRRCRRMASITAGDAASASMPTANATYGSTTSLAAESCRPTWTGWKRSNGSWRPRRQSRHDTGPASRPGPIAGVSPPGLRRCRCPAVLVELRAFVTRQGDLAQPDALRGDLDALVVADELHRLVE